MSGIDSFYYFDNNVEMSIHLRNELYTEEVLRMEETNNEIKEIINTNEWNRCAYRNV